MLRLFALLAAGAVFGAAGAEPAALDEQTALRIEALRRLKGADLESNPSLKGAVLKVLEKTRGTPQFVELVEEFKLKGHGEALLEYALAHPGESSGVEAFRLAYAELGKAAVLKGLDTPKASALVELIGNSSEKELHAVLRAAVSETARPVELRREMVKALCKSQDCAEFLIGLAEKGELPADLKLAASAELNRAPWPHVRKSAGELLPLPQSQNAEPLPPVHELAKRVGDPVSGEKLFFSETVACASCHQVNGKGMDYGPRLSEIGTKLGKEALYESILDPSAGISFGYEGWAIELQNGDEAFGLLASETEDEIAIKTQNGVTSRYKKSEVVKRQKLATSVMPAGLQLTMSTQELVDLIEFLATLRKQ